MLDSLNVPQPKPKPGTGPDIWALVISDMRQRNVLGTKKYGQPLRAGDGRDHLIDAYQEALDLAVYLRQEIEERRLATLCPQCHGTKILESEEKDVYGWNIKQEPCPGCTSAPTDPKPTRETYTLAQVYQLFSADVLVSRSELKWLWNTLQRYAISPVEPAAAELPDSERREIATASLQRHGFADASKVGAGGNFILRCRRCKGTVLECKCTAKQMRDCAPGTAEKEGK